MALAWAKERIRCIRAIHRPDANLGYGALPNAWEFYGVARGMLSNLTEPTLSAAPTEPNYWLTSPPT
jgi:hypothetical protein